MIKKYILEGKIEIFIKLIYNQIIEFKKLKVQNESVTGIKFDSTKVQFYSVGNAHISQSILLETFYRHTSKINYIETIPGEK